MWKRYETRSSLHSKIIVFIFALFISSFIYPVFIYIMINYVC